MVTTYHDLPLGAVDASVLALAERTGDYSIATLDRRHFTVIRPQGGKARSGSRAKAMAPAKPLTRDDRVIRISAVSQKEINTGR